MELPRRQLGVRFRHPGEPRLGMEEWKWFTQTRGLRPWSG